MRAEFELILRTACPELAADTDRRVSELLQQTLDWDALLGLAKLHGMQIPLASVLDRHTGDVPPDFLQQLHGSIRDRRDLNHLLVDAMFELLPQFEEIGVPVLPFKGPEMAVAIYGSLEGRPFSDVDFLIKSGNAVSAVNTVMRKGYTLKHGGAWDPAVMRWHHGETLKSPDRSYEADVHWDIMSVRAFGCRFTFEELWQRRMMVKLRDREVSSPSLDDLFLILCIHGCKHRWILVKWLRDIALLSNLEAGLDWKAIKRRASGMGAVRMVELSLHLVQELIGVAPPEAALREFPAGRAARALAADIGGYLSAEMEYAPEGRKRHKFYLDMRERLRDKIRFSVYLAKRGKDPTRFHVPLPAFFSILFSIAWPCWRLARGGRRTLVTARDNAEA